VKAKENIKRFFRKDLTFYVTSYIWIDLLLVYLQIVSMFKIRLELVKNRMQNAYIALIFMCKYR